MAITNDSVFEGTENFSLTLNTPVNATIGDGTQQVTIVDDGRNLPGGPANDDRPVVSIGNDVLIDEAAGTVTFTVSITGNTTQPVTVDFATANGTATAGSDYTAQSGSLSFAPGVTSQTITIAIANDTTYEVSEDFTVSISNPSNAVLGTASVTGTIVDDGRSLPGGPANDDRPGFSINDLTIDEAAGTVSFTVTRTGDLTQSAAVDYAGQDNTATGADYSVAAGTLNFAAGVATQTITVAINNDGTFEGAERFNINLSNPVGAVIVDGQGVGTIVDDGRNLPGGPANDDRPVFNLGSDVIIDEAAGTVTFTITKTGATDVASSVSYGTADGTATAGSDYAAASGTLNFAAGETSKTVTVAITNDSVFEGTENFSLTLNTPVNATIGDGTQQVTIVDDGRNLPGGPANDDRPVVSIGNDVLIDEAAGTVTFTVSITGNTTQPVTVDFATANGTATAGSDYTAQSGSLSFAPGVTSQTITIAIANDTTYEVSEDFTVSISNPSNAVLGTASVTGTIVDDGRSLPGGPANDDRPVLSIDSLTVTEGGYATFTAILSNTSTTAVTFTPSMTSGTAALGIDTSAASALEYYNGTAWVSASGGVSIPAGSTSVQLRLQTTDDLLDEALESFSLTGTVTSGNTANASATGMASITDNDATPRFSINDITVNEAAGTATFTVTLSAASGQATSVNWGLSNGTALAGSDYTNNSGTLNFAPGVTTQTITVAILNDTPRVYEGSETFNVNLSAAVNATISDNLGVGTIVDNGTGSGGSDDDRPTLSIDSPTVTEGGYAIFTATLSNASTTAVTFTVSLTSGTATLGADTSAASTLQYYNGSAWVSATGGVNIPAGSTSVQLRLQTTDDLLDEAAESFSLTGTVSSGNTTNASATGTASITDNDVLTVGNAVSDDDDVNENVDALMGNDLSHTGTISNAAPELLLSLGTTTSGLQSKGQNLVYSWDAASRTLTASTAAGTVFTVTLNAANDGYSFKQFAGIDHAVVTGENHSLSVPLTLIAQDALGNVLTTTGFSVVVSDDAPVVTGNLSIVTANDGAYADAGYLNLATVSNDVTHVTWNTSGPAQSGRRWRGGWLL